MRDESVLTPIINIVTPRVPSTFFAIEPITKTNGQ